jgi:hypothetical protein
MTPFTTKLVGDGSPDLPPSGVDGTTSSKSASSSCRGGKVVVLVVVGRRWQQADGGSSGPRLWFFCFLFFSKHSLPRD